MSNYTSFKRVGVVLQKNNWKWHFFAVFHSLMEQGADKTEVLNIMNNKTLGRKRKLRRIDEFL